MRHVRCKKILHTSGSMTLFQLFERYFHFRSFSFDSLPFLILEQYLQRKLLVYYLPKFCRLSQIYSQSGKVKEQERYRAPETAGEVFCRRCHWALRQYPQCLDCSVLFSVF